MENESSKKFNWPLVGNEHIIDFLSRSIINDKIAGSYIFLGPEDLGKTTVANYFAKSLLCEDKDKGDVPLPCKKCPSCRQFNFPSSMSPSMERVESEFNIIHGDYHLIKRKKEKKNISIEQIREFIRSLSMSSFLNSYKIGVIKEADNLSLGAANALLKTLEEPKEKVVIILIVSNIEALPSTITSRSQVLNFYPVKSDIIYNYLVENHKTSRSIAKNLSRLAVGRPALAIKFLEDKIFYSEYIDKVNVFLNFLTQGINERIMEIERMVGKQIYGQEPVDLALNIIEIWEGLARDFLLLNFGHNNLIQHEVVADKLEKVKDKFGFTYSGINLLKIVKTLKIGKEYLKANVNPRLVLENIAVSI
ncbi:MAG: AAA family ATPase [Patescibacteria group bacterium]